MLTCSKDKKNSLKFNFNLEILIYSNIISRILLVNQPSSQSIIQIMLVSQIIMKITNTILQRPICTDLHLFPFKRSQ